MIRILDKSQCCGCGACEQRCPKQCITLNTDQQGFLYPNVEESDCIDCHLCEEVCPVLNAGNKRLPIKAYAAINPNEDVRMSSSSGGVFTAIAENIIEHSGVVFGVRFNEKWEVVHDFTEKKEGLSAFRGSKYVQSIIGDSFFKVRWFLEQGRKVLFTGTPCQVAGLKNYLNKEYENLLIVEVACHGVPSPFVWKKYIEDKHPQHINFRDKKLGWKKFSMSINNYSQYHQKDSFMQCFLSNLCLRPSCFNCKFKAGSSGCDITLADFWGVTEFLPQLDDDKGVSAVLTYSDKGNEFLNKLNLTLIGVECSKVYTHNSAILYSVKQPYEYIVFWRDFYEFGKKSIHKWGKKQMVSPIIKIKTFVYQLLH